MAHVDASHLMDRNLFPFAALQATGVPDPGGDRAFDVDDADDGVRRSPIAIGMREAGRSLPAARTEGDSP